MIETLFTLERIPERVFYQFNGKSAQQNYKEQKNQANKKRSYQSREAQQEAALDRYIEKLVINGLDQMIDSAIKSLI